MTAMPFGGSPGAYLARVRLALSRFGWGNLAALLLCAASAASWSWLLPHLRAETAGKQRALAQAAAAGAAAPVAVAPRSRNEERIAAFEDMLGEKKYEEQQLKTVFAIAAKSGLGLERAEYKPAYDKAGRFHTYQILLPVKGTYPAIRQFCEQVLLAIPFASLDQLDFKRDAIGNNVVEAQLRFTLYLADPAALRPGVLVASHGGME